MKKEKYIFITGNNSKIGKGLIGSSIGVLLQSMGYKVRLLKISNYLNKVVDSVDSKLEVWVTGAGKSVSMDIGDYCHILGKDLDSSCFTTLGLLLEKVLEEDRPASLGDFMKIKPLLGREIKKFISPDLAVDFVIVEFGGSIGDFETNLLIESALGEVDTSDVFHVNVGFCPKTNESYDFDLFYRIYEKFMPQWLKTNLLILREEKTSEILNKLLPPKGVGLIKIIKKSQSIYEVPLLVNQENIIELILNYFNLEVRKIDEKNLSFFEKVKNTFTDSSLPLLKIGIVGKDVGSYDSIKNALVRASAFLEKKIQISIFDISLPSEHLKEYDGLVFGGGSGVTCTENLIQHIRYARQNNIPSLLICLSFQLALIEIARNILRIKDATSLEFKETGTQIICLMDKSKRPRIHSGHSEEYRRVGSFPVLLHKDSIVLPFYKDWSPSKENYVYREIFRHSYWFNYNFRKSYEVGYGIHFTFTDLENICIYGFELDRKLHKFFVGVKFHPENSLENGYHPLFLGLLTMGV